MTDVQEKILSRLQQDAANATALETYWQQALPGAPIPSPEQFGIWARQHRGNISAFLSAVDQSVVKFEACGRTMCLDHLIRYVSRTANCFKFGEYERKAA